MKRLLIALPVLLLTACDGGGDPVQQALRDASAERQAATVKDGAVSGPDHGAMEQGPAGAGNAAFAASETAMHDKMTAASGDTLDEAYVAKMIAHHEGAVEMARVALAQSQDPEIRRMAQGVVDAQTREIAELRAWKPAAN